MANPRVTAKLGLDTKEADDALKRWGEKSAVSLTELNQGLELFLKGWNLLTGAIKAGIGVVEKLTQAQALHETAQRQLAAAIGSSYTALAAYNEQLSLKLNQDTDDIAKVQTSLLAYGVQKEKIEAATRAAFGYAAATGKGVNEAIEKVSTAIRTNAAEFKRLESLYVVATTNAQTYEGRLRGLQSTWGDLQETLGSAITDSPQVISMMAGIDGAIRGVIEAFGGPGAKEIVNSFFGAIADGALIAASSVQSLATIIGWMTKNTTLLSLGVILHKAQVDYLDARSKSLARQESDRKAAEEFVGPPKPKAGVLTRSSAPTGAPIGGAFYNASVTPESYAGGFGYYSEADQEAERRDNERSAYALAVQEERIKREQAQRERLRTMREEDNALAEEQEQAHYTRLAQIGVAGVAGFVQGAVAAWASGRASLGEAALSAFGSMLGQIGSGLFSLGVAAVAAGTLGTVAPIFAGPTGGPVGVAAGLGLMAAGLTLEAFGGLAQAGARPSIPSGGAPSAGAVPSVGFSGASSARATTTTVINVTLSRGYVTGTPRQVGRELAALINDARTLRPT